MWQNAFSRILGYIQYSTPHWYLFSGHKGPVGSLTGGIDVRRHLLQTAALQHKDQLPIRKYDKKASLSRNSNERIKLKSQELLSIGIANDLYTATVWLLFFFKKTLKWINSLNCHYLYTIFNVNNWNKQEAEPFVSACLYVLCAMPFYQNIVNASAIQ